MTDKPIQVTFRWENRDEKQLRRIAVAQIQSSIGRFMSTIDIFVSFEFDKDNDLRNSFYRQAKEHTHHRIKNCSLNEAYPDKEWKKKAREAIRGCDIVIVLIGQDTHNAPGVEVETDMARSLGKPIIQVRPKTRPYKGLSSLDDPIPWKWKRINKELDEIRPRS